MIYLFIYQNNTHTHTHTELNLYECFNKPSNKKINFPFHHHRNFGCKEENDEEKMINHEIEEVTTTE